LFVGGLGAIGQARRAEGGPVKFGPGANFLARIRERQRRQPAQSGPCDPQSPHGYFGRDAPVVQAMKNWMLGRAFVRDIK
jgi:hypothetical protein